MNSIDMRRRTFLGLLGLAGAAAVITPAQEILLAAPQEPVTPVKEVLPQQGDIWFSSNGVWQRLGMLEQIAVQRHCDHYLSHVSSVFDAPVETYFNATVHGYSEELENELGKRNLFGFRIYMANYRFEMKDLFISTWEHSLSGDVMITEFEARGGQGAAIEHWS